MFTKMITTPVTLNTMNDNEPEQWTQDFVDCTDQMLEKWVDDYATPYEPFNS